MIESIRRLLNWSKSTPPTPATSSQWESEQETMRTVYRSAFPRGTDEAHIRAAALGHCLIATLPAPLRPVVLQSLAKDSAWTGSKGL